MSREFLTTGGRLDLSCPVLRRHMTPEFMETLQMVMNSYQHDPRKSPLNENFIRDITKLFLDSQHEKYTCGDLAVARTLLLEIGMWYFKNEVTTLHRRVVKDFVRSLNSLPKLDKILEVRLQRLTEKEVQSAAQTHEITKRDAKANNNQETTDNNENTNRNKDMTQELESTEMETEVSQVEPVQIEAESTASHVEQVPVESNEVELITIDDDVEVIAINIEEIEIQAGEALIHDETPDTTLSLPINLLTELPFVQSIDKENSGPFKKKQLKRKDEFSSRNSFVKPSKLLKGDAGLLHELVLNEVNLNVGGDNNEVLTETVEEATADMRLDAETSGNDVSGEVDVKPGIRLLHPPLPLENLSNNLEVTKTESTVAVVKIEREEDTESTTKDLHKFFNVGEIDLPETEVFRNNLTEHIISDDFIRKRTMEASSRDSQNFLQDYLKKMNAQIFTNAKENLEQYKEMELEKSKTNVESFMMKMESIFQGTSERTNSELQMDYKKLESDLLNEVKVLGQTHPKVSHLDFFQSLLEKDRSAKNFPMYFCALDSLFGSKKLTMFIPPSFPSIESIRKTQINYGEIQGREIGYQILRGSSLDLDKEELIMALNTNGSDGVFSSNNVSVSPPSSLRKRQRSDIENLELYISEQESGRINKMLSYSTPSGQPTTIDPSVPKKLPRLLENVDTTPVKNNSENEAEPRLHRRTLFKPTTDGNENF